MERPIHYQVFWAIMAVLLLNSFLSTSITSGKWFRLSSDLLFLLPLLIIATSFSKRPNYWIHLFSILICILGLYRFLNLLTDLIFHRPFSFFDVLLIPELDYLVNQSLTTIEKSFLVLSILIIAMVSYTFIFLFSRLLTKSFSLSIKNTTAGILLGFGLIVFIQFLVILKEGSNFSLTRGPYIKDFIYFFDRAIKDVRLNENQYLLKQEIKLANSSLDENAYDLSRLSNTNVIVIFIESYGAVLVENPDLLNPYKKFYSEMQTLLEKKSFSMVSGYSEAPDGSWNSRLSFSTGTNITHRYIANLAMVSNLTTLNQKFSQLNHTTLSFMPGVTEPVLYIETFFDFQNRIRFWNLDWPKDKSFVGWPVIPDQYALEWLGRKPTLKNITPFYAEIVLSSSHSPFGRVPSYITDGTFNLEDYHSRIQGKKDSLSIFSYLESSPEKYMISIEYSLRSSFDFILKYLDKEDLIILIGDHQPPVLRTDSFLVPVHIISGNRSLLSPFKKLGFQKELFSLEVKRNISHEDFAQFILESYSSHQRE